MVLVYAFMSSSLQAYGGVSNVELHLLLLGKVEELLCGVVYAIYFVLWNSMVLHSGISS